MSGSSRSRDWMTDRVSSSDRCRPGRGDGRLRREAVGAVARRRPRVARDIGPRRRDVDRPLAAKIPSATSPRFASSGWSRNPSRSACCHGRADVPLRPAVIRRRRRHCGAIPHAQRRACSQAASNSLPIWLQRSDFIRPSRLGVGRGARPGPSRQSRSTVATETPSATATSGTVRPPK